MTVLNEVISSLVVNMIEASVIVGLIIICWYRSGSAFSMLDKLWKLITGKENDEDEVLKKHLQDTKNLERFKFIHSVKVDSISEMHKFLNWVKKNSISLIDAKKASQWIDVRTEAVLTVPTKRYENAMGILLILCSSLLILSTVPTTAKYALLQFNESKTRFIMGNDSARSITASWELDEKTCSNVREKKTPINGLRSDEVDLICDGFNDKKITKHIEKTINAQKTFGLVLILMFSICGAYIYMKLISVSAAKRINKKLQECECTNN